MTGTEGPTDTGGEQDSAARQCWVRQRVCVGLIERSGKNHDSDDAQKIPVFELPLLGGDIVAPDAVEQFARLLT